MMLGCLGFIAFIMIVIWAFIVSPLLGSLAIFAGFALFVWKGSTLKILGGLSLVASIVWGFSIHWILGVIFVIIGLAIIGWDMEQKEVEEEKELTLNNLIENENFNVTHQFNGDKKQIFVVDETTNRFAYLNGTDHCRVYPISDILEVKVKVDDNLVTRTSNELSASGAILGGALGGGLGAVIGGVKRKHRVENKVKRIAVHIVVSDTSKPTIMMDFFKGSMEQSSDTVENAYNEASALYDLLTVLMR